MIQKPKMEHSLKYFIAAHDWIKRHQDCDCCNMESWKGAATTLSNVVQWYVQHGTDTEQTGNEHGTGTER